MTTKRNGRHCSDSQLNSVAKAKLKVKSSPSSSNAKGLVDYWWLEGDFMAKENTLFPEKESSFFAAFSAAAGSVRLRKWKMRSCFSSLALSVAVVDGRRRNVENAWGGAVISRRCPVKLPCVMNDDVHHH